MWLVTGGAGFIGSHTVELLRKKGHSVRVLDNLSTGSRDNLEGLDVELMVGSIEDPDAVARAMKGVERVVHLAARISVPESVESPLLYDATNVHGTLQVLEGARRAGVQRVSLASSCAIYGSLPGLPKLETSPIHCESPYAANKAANEMYARSYSETMGLEVVALRYFNVFGPRQDPAGPYGAVIPKFVEWALAGQTLTIFGDGEQGRDFVSVRDVARANVMAASGDAGAGEVFNVGGGRMMTINQLAAQVSAAVPHEVSFRHEAPRPGDVRASMASVDKASEILGWKPEADFDAALAETVEWFVQRGGELVPG